MNVFTGILVYVMIWWVLLFTILPWGVTQPLNTQVGHDKGAPENPNLKRKLLLTTVISAVLWLIYYWIMKKYG